MIDFWQIGLGIVIGMWIGFKFKVKMVENRNKN